MFNLNVMNSETNTAVCAYQRFIVIDDDKINNLVSKFVINRFTKDAQLHVYTDPELALGYIAQLENDSQDRVNTLVLLDINMPRMNGWEFLDALQELDFTYPAHFNIYIISSSIDPADIKRAQDHALVSGFFSKPLTIDYLSKTCDSVSKTM